MKINPLKVRVQCSIRIYSQVFIFIHLISSPNNLSTGANVNVLPSCGRTALGRAAQLGHLAIVCLLLDAEKFYSTPEEEDVDTESLFSCVSSSSSSLVGLASGVTSCASRGTLPQDQRQSPTTTGATASASSIANLRPTLGGSLLSPQGHKCCSPSIDSETCTCSDEVRLKCLMMIAKIFYALYHRSLYISFKCLLKSPHLFCNKFDKKYCFKLTGKWLLYISFQLWGLDLSDSNQQSDWEPGRCNRELPSNNNEEVSEVDIQDSCSVPLCSHTTSPYTPSNIGYYVFEYREEEEDTGRCRNLC